MLEKITKFLLRAFLFLLPWQTILILQENYLNGAKWQYGTIGFYATEIIFWPAVLVFIAWFWRKKNASGEKSHFRLTKDRMFLFFCFLFAVYSLASSLWAQNREVAFEQARHIMEAVILFIMLFIGPLNFKEAVLSLASGALLQSFLGLWQFFTQSTFDYKWVGLVAHPVFEAGTSIVAGAEIGRFLRAYGAFPHPNILGGYLALSLILLIYLAHKIHKITLPYWFKFIFLLAALFFTFSRSAWIAFGVFIIMDFIFGFIVKNKKMLAISSYFIIIAIILVVINFSIVETRLFLSSENELTSATERINSIEESWQIFKSHPFFGVGAGNYTVAAYNLHPDLPGWSYQPAHNVFLLILSELGITGILILLFALAAFINCLRGQIMPRFYFLLVIFGLLLVFDHYLFSFYSGLMLSAAYLGLIGRPKHGNIEA